ncbi:hypothetical protein ACFFX1_51885 [Dactylosporangium sucinum]|uniref:Lipoprotein n=1 Tax=Dactylosporangium sucinum TaxID=1424081 RepID=A0A917WVJ0_9ACTN|nr:hypothetical protein [Dactylosporangium sucinum]GGM36302.1 hypothetical protein GCM10007977_042090 [Dactylosporangium sucinum]
MSTTTSDHRRRVLTGLLATVLLGALAACTTDDKPAAQPTTGAGAGPATAALPAFAGLYVTPEVIAVPLPGDGLRMVTAQRCDRLVGMLGAGQWYVADELRYPEDAAGTEEIFGGLGLMPALLLRRGDQRVFATLEGVTDCTATLTSLPAQEITVSGAGLPGTRAGWSGTTRCYRSGGNLTVSFYFDTDAHVGAIGTVTFAADGSLSADELSIAVIQHSGALLRTLSALDWSGEKPKRGVTVSELSAEDGGGAKVSLTGPAERPAGTLTLPALSDDTGELGQVGITVPFACAEVGTLGA